MIIMFKIFLSRYNYFISNRYLINSFYLLRGITPNGWCGGLKPNLHTSTMKKACIQDKKIREEEQENRSNDKEDTRIHDAEQW